ncbi:hypothetical protein AZE42_11527 [Rhizopogon vesiculosus]|uniref:Uncharacterized protein n=1 Tax=Rhizopogon vesiculosus TaxID=180088 RepID=A0A1J8R2J9_9AGAM|nr:hypothetical protein AZE42_11527 [Rhizopogon vesiculosus]
MQGCRGVLPSGSEEGAFLGNVINCSLKSSQSMPWTVFRRGPQMRMADPSKSIQCLLMALHLIQHHSSFRLLARREHS